MKFPVNKQSKGQNSKSNTNAIKKEFKQSLTQTKVIKNQRNIIQQQRAATLGSQKNGTKGKKYQNEEDVEQQPDRGYEEEEQNMDAYVNIGALKGNGKSE